MMKKEGSKRACLANFETERIKGIKKITMILYDNKFSLKKINEK